MDYDTILKEYTVLHKDSSKEDDANIGGKESLLVSYRRASGCNHAKALIF
jgi:hypothetical protein